MTTTSNCFGVLINVFLLFFWYEYPHQQINESAEAGEQNAQREHQAPYPRFHTRGAAKAAAHATEPAVVARTAQCADLAGKVVAHAAAAGGTLVQVHRGVEQ